ncbi:MAG TPA: hypothetical protein VIM22_00005 [Solirubrobacteraceae bacterium]
MARTIFILGGTGFIGQEVGQAVAAGFEVRAMARSEGSSSRLTARTALTRRSATCSSTPRS